MTIRVAFPNGQFACAVSGKSVSSCKPYGVSFTFICVELVNNLCDMFRFDGDNIKWNDSTVEKTTRERKRAEVAWKKNMRAK